MRGISFFDTIRINKKYIESETLSMVVKGSSKKPEVKKEKVSKQEKETKKMSANMIYAIIICLLIVFAIVWTFLTINIHPPKKQSAGSTTQSSLVVSSSSSKKKSKQSSSSVSSSSSDIDLKLPTITEKAEDRAKADLEKGNEEVDAATKEKVVAYFNQVASVMSGQLDEVRAPHSVGLSDNTSSAMFNTFKIAFRAGYRPKEGGLTVHPSKTNGIVQFTFTLVREDSEVSFAGNYSLNLDVATLNSMNGSLKYAAA